MSAAWLRVAGCALIWTAALVSPLPAGGAGAASKTNVEASAETQIVLDRARAAMGGAKRLNSVSTLRIEGDRTLRSGEKHLFVDRLLFPDRYKTEGAATHSIDGPAFWQRPEPVNDAVRATALRNVTRRFTEQSLLYLLRAPGIMPLRARIQSRTAAAVTVSFDGPDGFQRSIVFDSGSGLPVELFHDGTLTSSGVRSTVQRRLVIEARADRGGIQMPARIRETIGADVAQITVSTVVVDGAVTLRDFRAEK